MLRGTDLGLQISAGHHLQSRREKKNISSLNQSFPVFLMGLRNKSQFLFLKEINSSLMQPRLLLAMPGRLHAKHKQCSYSKFWERLLSISMAWEWVSRITCKHLYCCSWLQQTPARTAGLWQPLLSHILTTLQSKGCAIQSPAPGRSRSITLQGWHPCLTPSRGIIVFLLLFTMTELL